jgi:hypothetical protein
VTERDLVRRLAETLEERFNTYGHPAALILNREHRGTCPPYECSARCQVYRALLIEAAQYLDATQTPSAEQLPLLAGSGE